MNRELIDEIFDGVRFTTETYLRKITPLARVGPINKDEPSLRSYFVVLRESIEEYLNLNQ